eukprot:8958552-Pyramimonas_sp.AAC.1
MPRKMLSTARARNMLRGTSFTLDVTRAPKAGQPVLRPSAAIRLHHAAWVTALGHSACRSAMEGKA